MARKSSEHPKTRLNLLAFIAAIFFVLLSACQTSQASPSLSPTLASTFTLEPSTTTPGGLINTPTPTPTPTQDIPINLRVQPGELKGLRIHFWFPWTGEAASSIASIADEFNQVNVWGFQVEVNNFGSSLQLIEQLKSSQTSGQLPELVAAPIDQLMAWQRNSERIQPLSEYIHSPQWGLLEQEIADFQPVFWEQDQIDGSQMVIPALRNGEVLFYNQSWANEMGFNDPPADPATFRLQACAAELANMRTQRIDKQGTGGWLIDTQPLPLLSWIAAFGGNPVPISDSQGYLFNAAPVQQAFDYLTGMSKDTCIWPRRLPSPYEYFSKRMALFYSASISEIPNQAKQQLLSKSSDNWTIIPYPGQNGKPLMLVDGPSYAVLTSSPPQQMAAWLFLRWLVLPRNQARLASASSLLPASILAIDQLQSYGKQNPQWNQAVNLIQFAQPGPRVASWTIAGPILEDAGWQLFHQALTPIAVPVILQQIDDTIPQILNYSSPTPKP